MIVVENAAVHPSGSGTPFTLRVDEDRFISGLSDLAGVIKKEVAIARRLLLGFQPPAGSGPVGLRFWDP